jgi:hypothetical protein
VKVVPLQGRDFPEGCLSTERSFKVFQVAYRNYIKRCSSFGPSLKLIILHDLP